MASLSFRLSEEAAMGRASVRESLNGGSRDAASYAQDRGVSPHPKSHARDTVGGEYVSGDIPPPRESAQAQRFALRTPNSIENLAFLRYDLR